MALLGNGALSAAAVLFAGAAAVGLWPVLAPGRGRAVPAAWPFRLHAAGWALVTAAMALMIGLFLTDAFAFLYVAGRSSRALAPVYKVTALWAGQEGSLILWLWLQAGFGLVIAGRARSGKPLHRGAAGTDVALETADVVLMGDRLAGLVEMHALARHTMRRVRQNLAIAFGVIGVLVLLTLTADLPLALGVLGHEGSTVLVALNGLRILGWKGEA